MADKPKKLEVDVEISRKTYRALFKLVEIHKRYVVLEDTRGVRHTLFKRDNMIISWDEE